MTRRPALTLWALLLAAAVHAQPEGPRLDLLDERLRIPDSERFDEGAYIESGVGLRFGVDKQLSYLAGDYQEAVSAFEAQTRAFRYKAEIWVYLARAHFYTKSPERARQTLIRARELMPDLSERLWDPLLESLAWEIRQRARRQQERVDFYSVGQDEVLSLFRLYEFLEDEASAVDLVAEAYRRARIMRERARMVSGSTSADYVAQARRWTRLGSDLTAELQGRGIEVPARPPEPAGPGDASADIDEELSEQDRIRNLQLRVDFYSAELEEFQELFDLYLDRAEINRARQVLDALGRFIGDLEIAASVAATASQETQIENRILEVRQALQSMRARLPEPADEVAGEPAVP